MKYKGIEIKEIPTTERRFFTPPKEMYVWDADDGCDIHTGKVVAIIPERQETFRAVTEGGAYSHCAEIPELKTVTNRELSRWLAEGKGEVMDQDGLFTSWFYWKGKEDTPVKDSLYVRKWSETEWHAPTREYLGLEDK